MSDNFRVAKGNITDLEKNAQADLLKHLRSTPIPDSELIHNLSIFMPRQHLARLLYLADIFRQTETVFGDIFVMGVRWGFEMALFGNLKTTLTPYAFDKKIVGFDTFEGFQSTSDKDGGSHLIRDGSYAVESGYEAVLESLLSCHRDNSPRANVERFELVKGDVTKTLGEYLEKHPQTVVSLLHIDIDLYLPTRHCIEAVFDRMPVGGVLSFDELNHAAFPGETLALLDTIGLNKHKLVKCPWNPGRGYMVKC